MRRAAELSGLAATVAFLALLCAGCAVSGGSVASRLWPETADPYLRLTRDWTRTAALRQGLDRSLSAAATLESRPWREGFANRYARAYALPADEEAKFLADQMLAHAQGTDVVLSLAAEQGGLAELRFDDPLWRIVAVQGDTVFRPLEIAPLDKDRWPAEKLGLFFPQASRWRSFYGLRFPRLAEGPVTLTMSGPAGRLEFTWEHFE